MALEKKWDWEIKSESFWLRWELRQLWLYRHLLMRLVRRDFLIHHQQTILGPAWIIFQPLIVLAIYVVVFERAVGLSTDGLPPTLFYLSGIILWNLFSECFTGSAFTFIQNGTIFSKVYFPRLIMPLAVIVGNIIRFAIQFVVFLGMLLFMAPDQLLSHPILFAGVSIFCVAVLSLLGLGSGLIFSILTAKYRDLVNMIHLIVRLLMFATPIIYPLSMVGEEMRTLVTMNPMTSIVELFRFGTLGQGVFTISQLLYSVVITVVLLGVGSILFNKYSSQMQDVI